MLLLFSFSALAILLSPLASFGAEAGSSRAFTERDMLLRAEMIYAAAAREAGQRFKIAINDGDEREYAEAESDGRNLVVTVSLRLIENPRLTVDGFGFVLCHEIGHLFGGAPRRGLPPEWDGPVAPDGLSFSSAEGQADHYATAQCFRHLVAGQDHRAALSRLVRDRVLTERCEQRWGRASEEAMVCERAVLGGLSYLELYQRTGISVSIPAEERVERTISDQYPSRQCRLDTILRGALCRAHSAFRFDFFDSARNECLDPEGTRPACWFR